MNERADPDAKIVSLKLDVSVVRDKNHRRSPTEDDYDEVVLDEPSIVIGGYQSEKTEHKAPNGTSFRAEDLLDAVEEHERLTRGSSEWFGGIDCHHIYFEGLHKQADGSYSVHWGS
jgi:hypothetical protein